MKKRSKRIEYVRCGKNACLLWSAYKCKDTEVVIPNKVLFKGRVVAIDKFAFSDNNRMKSVIIPSDVVSIGESAFDNCENLETVVLPKELKSIGTESFKNCKKLKSILFPPTVIAIAAKSFVGCCCLESIDLSHVRSIGERAFEGCDSLSDIKISDGVEEINANSFRDSGYFNEQANWENGLLRLGKWVIGSKGTKNEYVIKKDTVGIASDVFNNEWHVKRTSNPEYESERETYEAAMVCFQMRLPDLSKIPEYLEEIIPIRIRYEGTSDEWSKIIKLQGEKQIPATVITDDETIETYL